MVEFGAAIEGLAAAEIRAIQNERLAKQLSYLWARSPFYQDKLSSAGLGPDSVRSVEDLTAVPFTIKDDIRKSLAASPPLGNHLAAQPSDIVQFQASTGTTGRPSYVGLTAHDRDNWAEITRRTFWAHGFRPGERVLQALGMSRCWVGGVPVIQGLEALGAACIPAGAEPGTTWLLHTIADLNPTGLVATPNFAVYLGNQAKEVLGVNAHQLPIERIYVGGEPGGGIPEFRRHAEALWGAQMREVMGGTDLSPVMWAECEDQSGMHFVAPELIYWEIVDNAGDPVEITTGATGELVYSHLDRQATPVLRFRHSDMIEVLDTECRCGRTSPKIKCYGRTDDLMIIKGVNFYPTALQDIVMGMRPATSGSVRILKHQPEYTWPGPLHIRVERGEARSPEADGELASKLTQAISDLCRVRATVEVVSFGTYPSPGREKVRLIEKMYET
ncbi:MAG: AMP-binding protein [bacterium]|nr:AMP-binding protein [Acidimicrobiia bacterium]MCY4650027.1 AMP-binding protein [bacterium]